MARTTIRLTPDNETRAKERCHLIGTSLTWLVNTALDDYLARTAFLNDPDNAASLNRGLHQLAAGHIGPRTGAPA